MEDLKMRANFVRRVRNRTGQFETKPRSLKRISEQKLRTLTDQIADIICAEVMPGMKKNHLYDEIQKMVEAHPR